MILELVLPLPPTINHCYFYIKGRKIKSKVARDYEANVSKQLSNLSFVSFEENKKIVCEMRYYFPDRRKRDTHNTFKILFDILEDCNVYKNDQYVLPRVIDFDVDKHNPRVELKLYYK